MTLTQLNAFVLVARLGSVRAAAAALGVSESAVSQALTALRQDLGDQLITRSQVGMTLTPGGTRLLGTASQIVVLGAEAHAAVRAAQGAPEQLRIVATSTFAALKGSMIIRGPHGSREVSARAFHTGPYETVVGPTEMLTEIRLPIRPHSGSAYVKVARRAGDWPIGAAGVAVRLAGGVIADVGIGLTAVGAAHFVAAEAEEFLRGQVAGEEAFTRAGEIAAEHCNPASDQRGPAEYKRHLVRELTARMLRLAVSRARGIGPVVQAP